MYKFLVSVVYNGSGIIKHLTHFKNDFDLNFNFHFNWGQLIHSIPKDWKLIIRQNIISHDKLFLDHHLINRNRLGNVENFSFLISFNIRFRNYFINKLANQNLTF